MKKILIVNNNMMMGGIQKSLINLLNHLSGEYEITLLLFSDYGELFEKIPAGVTVVFASAAFRTLGSPWQAIRRNPFLAAHKVFLTLLNKAIGKWNTMKYLSIFQKKQKGYDAVISFSHATDWKELSICCPEFVLQNTVSDNKICFIHCDYPNSGTASEYNNALYEKFDKIACCSDSVRERFLSVVPSAAEKTYTVRNFYDDQIAVLAQADPIEYDDGYVNVLSVARLSREKGIGTAIEALRKSGRSDVRYYVLGDGPESAALKEQVSALGMTNVFFEGLQMNPYRYMRNADYLLVPSFHEAAPMVFDEANLLNLRVISTETTSAREMLENGIVSNDLERVFKELRKEKSSGEPRLFLKQKEQFQKMIG